MLYANNVGETDTCTSASVAASGQCVITLTFSPTLIGAQNGLLRIVDNAVGSPRYISVEGVGVGAQGALEFIPMTPCRVADTRDAAGAFGGPSLSAGATREFDIPQSNCGVPASAAAYSLNVTAVPDKSLQYLTLWSSGEAQPNVSTLNSYDGRVKANAAITTAGSNGGVNVFASDASNVILDIDGYFVQAGTRSPIYDPLSFYGLAYYPLPPCRVVDTRKPATSDGLGGPFLAGPASRDFPVRSSNCNIPYFAEAYALNVTAVPHTKLGYLTLWPTEQTQPYVSTLNAPTGAVTANFAIVPAGGNGGEISMFVTDDADVILDINGYFASPASTGLSLYTTLPCRILDTRLSSGVFDGTLQPVAVENSACAPRSTAEAYVLNATVLPPGPLDFLTLWPGGEMQRDASTLNAYDGAVTSNMAIISTDDGSINVFSSNPTQLILDTTNYFAP